MPRVKSAESWSCLSRRKSAESEAFCHVENQLTLKPYVRFWNQLNQQIWSCLHMWNQPIRSCLQRRKYAESEAVWNAGNQLNLFAAWEISCISCRSCLSRRKSAESFCCVGNHQKLSAAWEISWSANFLISWISCYGKSFAVSCACCQLCVLSAWHSIMPGI